MITEVEGWMKVGVGVKEEFGMRAQGTKEA